MDNLDKPTGAASLEKFFLPALLWSAPIAALAEMLQRYLPFGRYVLGAVESPDAGRFLYYFGIAYLSLIPWLTMRIRIHLANDKAPYNSFAKKIAVTAMGVTALPAFLALPIFLVWLGPESVGRARLLYVIAVESLLGLWLVGGILIYGSSIIAWMLTCGLRRLWQN